MKYTLRSNLPTISDDYVEDVLRERGIAEPDRFKKPTKEDLLDPYGIVNIEAGVDLLASHIAKGSKIFLQVDADADGYSSSAIFHNYMQKVAPNTEIVWRVHEGKQHGVIPETVPDDCALVVIIDAGSNQEADISYLYELGKEVLIIDHHHPESEFSSGVLVNNQMLDYENPWLSGGGVMYKFLQVFDDKYAQEPYADSQLDLVALSLISDMMNLSSYENRYLIWAGLREVHNHGLRALIEKQEYSIGDITNLTPEKIAFYITPLINAIVRVGTKSEKETMFLAFIDGTRRLPSEKRGAKAGDIETAAQQTARVATNARNRQNKLKDQAIALMQQKIIKYGLDEHKVILITLDERESEIVDSTLTGLIAMQLTKQYKRPILITRSNDEGTIFSGSGRGINDSALDDFRLFCEESGVIEYAQGHAQAFGYSISKVNREAFLKYADEKLANIDFTESFYEVDYEFTEQDDIYSPILQLGEANQMWGQGVTAPIFVIKDAQVFAKDVQIMGKNKEHLKMKIAGVDCVKFFATDLMNQIAGVGSFRISILGKANINNWMGRTTPQFMIDDYEVHPNTYDF